VPSDLVASAHGQVDVGSVRGSSGGQGARWSWCNPIGKFVAPSDVPPHSHRGVGESFELPGRSAHMGLTTEDDAVGDGQHVPAGLVDQILLVDADQMHFRESDAGRRCRPPRPRARCVRLRMCDDSYSCRPRLPYHWRPIATTFARRAFGLGPSQCSGLFSPCMSR